jgi:prolyl-tRNA editing enzyme YbaK/EbsC (Cys-tRNA(Pro) deacylase)
LSSGTNQVDIKHLETYAGEGITKADAGFVREITGFAIGGIPPVGHKNVIDFIYIDHDLLDLDEVWAAAGTPNAVFCIKSQDLLKATNGKVINIKEKK